MAKRLTRRAFLFVTMVTNCVTVGLLSMSLGTHSWVSSQCDNSIAPEGKGSARFGIFDGYSELSIKTTIKKHYRLVCLESLCMYSAKETKSDRQESLRRILDSLMAFRGGILYTKKKKVEKKIYQIQRDSNGNGYFHRVAEHAGILFHLSSEYPSVREESNENSDAELMKEEVVIVTVVALCLALFFSVAAAFFGAINSATNPYQFITGIPGLYIWNICAAVCELIALVCGGILFSEQLGENMLLEDAEDGWTNEGLGHLGYSYWLMLVSLVLHCANCLLVFLATREKTSQQQYQAPISTSADTMLY